MTTVDFVLRNARVITPGRILHSGFVVISGNRISAIGDEANAPSCDGKIVDCNGAVVSAGLVDVQVNGGGGFMFSTDISREAFEAIARAHGRLGTTSLCATIISGPTDQMEQAVSLAADLCEKRTTGCARIVGIHLEGPFLAEAKRGGHAKQHLRAPDVQELRRLLDAGRGFVRIVTLAPELPGSSILIEEITARDIFVSAGHTAAPSQAVLEAIDHGLKGVTHLFNGMEGLSSRAPGVAGVALSNDALVCGLIGDLLHVSPEMLKVALRAKVPGTLYLTTDAVSPIGSDRESFDLYGVQVRVRDGGCYTSDGVLAGTATPLAHMVANLRDEVEIPEAQAFDMATRVPASLIGDSLLGSLVVGGKADIAVFNKSADAIAVFIDGERIV